MKLTLVLTAGGVGERFNAGKPKQLLLINDKPIIKHSLECFCKIDEITDVVVVHHPEIKAELATILTSESYNIHFTTGKSSRFDSVKAGVDYISWPCSHVLIHDAVRPNVSLDLIKRVINELQSSNAVIPAIPVTDTIKKINKTRDVVETVDRNELVAVQTPQGFDLHSLSQAYNAIDGAGASYTDEASLIEKQNEMVKTVLGDAANIKITVPTDLAIAELLINQRRVAD